MQLNFVIAISAFLFKANAENATFNLVTTEWPHFNTTTSLHPQQPDQELQSMLAKVSPVRIQQTIAKLVSFGTRHTLSSQTDAHRGIGAARDWIAAEMQRYAAASGGRMTVAVHSYQQPVAPRVPAPVTLSNVVARLEGVGDAARVYVVSGHYDSINSDILNAQDDAPGADDDASGVAVVLELCRIMATTTPQATILFAAVAGEEQGLLGSNFMATELREQGTDVQAMLNNDIVGSSTGDAGQKEPRVLRLFAQGLPTTLSAAQTEQVLRVGGENDSPARQLARFVRDVASNEATGMDVQIIYRLDRYGRSGDHASFLKQGYPAVRFTEPNENFAHQHQTVRVQDGVQYGDLLEFCDFEYVARVAKVNMATLWSLANAPGTVRNVTLDAASLTNDSKLSWSKLALPGVAGYEVVWRPTVSAYWTNVWSVGDVAGTTLAISKDNVVFGIRAVGKNGYRGLVTPAGMGW